jgi:hypothetical protein
MLFLILGAVSAADTNATVQSSIDDAQIDLNDDDNNLESPSAEELGAGEDANVLEAEDNADNLSSGEDTNVLESVNADNLTSGGDVAVVAASEKAVVADKKASVKVTSHSTIVNFNEFSVRVTDAAGKAVAGKTVKFSLNGKHFSRTTDAKGYAKLKLNLPTNYYGINYMFNEKGYTTVKGKTTFLVVKDNQSKITASTYVAYRGFPNPYTVALSVDGVKLANKKIRLAVGDKVYYRMTDSNGKAHLNIYLKQGKYVIKYAFGGGDNIKKSNGCKTLIVKQGMPIKITAMSSLTMKENVVGHYKVKVIDARGNPVKGKIVFKVAGKQYVKAIDNNGYAFVTLKLKAGTYKIASYHNKDSLYNYRYLSKNLKVLQTSKDNGFWLFGSDMKKVNLKELYNYGTKHIFLNYYALEAHGKADVEKFIADAGRYGINVHIWMQVFYSGGSWISPVNDDGSYKYDFFNSKIEDAKYYASLKGVAGVHLDYLRFPGTAYKHTNGVEAINYFTKQLANAVHKINSKLIVSAAVMPEVDSNIHYYGQDIPTLSKYLDVIVPMVYKGNYHAGSGWIKSTTNAFVQQSNGAKIWTGLQAYKSDDDVTLLSSSELFDDAKAAMAGGAAGVVLFRWGVSNLIDFSKL